MNPITTIRSRSFVLGSANIDTDQIIPARFLTTTTKAGLGQHCFHDWRHRADGAVDTDAPLNRRDPARQRILVAGHNFGCGSSREHAPWALSDFGFQAVISSGIADIFRNNALKNGLLAIVVGPEAHQRLLEAPDDELTIDLVAQRIRCAWGEEIGFAIDPFARACLIEGVDELGYLLARRPLIDHYEQQRRAA